MGCHFSNSTIPQTLTIGSDIRDQYRIGKLLGSGSFGQVHECSRRSDGEVLAVKIMERKLYDIGPWSNESMFRREVELLGFFDNPNIIKFIDFYEDRQFLYVVIERCDGGELFEQIVKAKRFNERDASFLCRQMLNAVAYVHSTNIVHRDIKAENFLFKDKDIKSNLKLIDFGMSAKLTSPTMTLSELCGSPHYLSPEVIRKEYNAKADMWALGVLLYLMLFGRYPFDGKTTDVIMKQILKNSVDFAPGNISLSPEAIDLMKQLLERDPVQRVAAVSALEHQWIDQVSMDDTETNEGVPQSALSADLITCAQDVHWKLVAPRKTKLAKKLEARRNERLERLEKQWQMRHKVKLQNSGPI